jgi:hypothetical protein
MEELVDRVLTHERVRYASHLGTALREAADTEVQGDGWPQRVASRFLEASCRLPAFEWRLDELSLWRGNSWDA